MGGFELDELRYNTVNIGVLLQYSVVPAGNFGSEAGNEGCMLCLGLVFLSHLGSQIRDEVGVLCLVVVSIGDSGFEVREMVLLLSNYLLGNAGRLSA
jgi:hypothetical protein